jgi:hypothetical protein
VDNRQDHFLDMTSISRIERLQPGKQPIRHFQESPLSLMGMIGRERRKTHIHLTALILNRPANGIQPLQTILEWQTLSVGNRIREPGQQIAQ